MTDVPERGSTPTSSSACFPRPSRVVPSLRRDASPLAGFMNGWSQGSLATFVASLDH